MMAEMAPTLQIVPPRGARNTGEIDGIDGFLLTAFRRHLEAEHQSPATAESYSYAVSQLADYLRSTESSTNIVKIDRGQIEDFLNDLRARGKSEATVETRFRGLAAYFKWAVSYAEIPVSVSPMEGMKRPKVPKKPVQMPEHDDLKKVIDSLRGGGFLERRDEALIRMFLSTGLRLTEMASIIYNDDPDIQNTIDLASQNIVVTGKGEKFRIVHYGPETAAALDGYLLARDRYLGTRTGRQYRNDPHLWLGRKGAMTPSGLRQAVWSRTDAAGIERHPPHHLRHYWAHSAMENGMEIPDLEKLAGWEPNSPMPSRYGALLKQDRALAAAKKFNPGEGF